MAVAELARALPPGTLTAGKQTINDFAYTSAIDPCFLRILLVLNYEAEVRI
jgi:hypothetical protein